MIENLKDQKSMNGIKYHHESREEETSTRQSQTRHLKCVHQRKCNIECIVTWGWKSEEVMNDYVIKIRKD